MIPPPDPTTGLLETLAARARTNPSAIAVHFEGRDLTIGGLWREINGVAEALAGRGLSSGDRVVLIHPNSPEFLSAFFGVQLAGGVAVPVFPDSGGQRVADISRSCGAATILVSLRLSERRQEEILDVGDAAGLTVLSPHDCAGADEATDRPFPRHDQLAYLQYTSGSTGNPKGVKLTHGNLVTNIHQMIAGFEITGDDVFVSWLPVSHDMGLILMTMTPLLLGARLILMPTSVGSIRRWMATIAEYRGTFTAAPDFAYRIAIRAASPRRSLDLSCLRVALNAAEPVRAKTIVDFESTFQTGRCVVPAYGLAEATVGVAGRPPGAEVKVDDRGLVSAGTPFPGVEIEIHDESGTVETAEVGEIVVRSPAATSGYFLNPDATQRLLTPDGAIRTGDTGYLDSDGELFIAGRKKSIIIQAGRNIAPQEIEETVDELDFVRRSAAIGVDRGGPEGEQAWVVVEIRASEKARKERHPEMVIEIVQAIRDRLGRRPGRVYLVQARTIPITHNGKVRHLDLRTQMLGGSIHDQGRIIYPVH